LIALVFAMQAVIDRYLTQAADAQARQMEQSSVLRVELLGRIVHDIDERRILIGYHIIESDAQTMAQVERQIAENADDFRQARDHFIQRLDAANQLSLWRTADAQLASLERAEAEVLELSRADDSGRARSALRKLHPRYEELEGVLEQLIELSRQSALVSMARVQELQTETNRVIWAVAMAGVAALAVLGAWLLRRISAYELRVAQHAAELEQRNRDLDAFAGRVAHDLKNALARTASSPWLLRRCAHERSRVLELSDKLETSMRSIVSMLDALLAFSRGGQTLDSDETATLEPVLNSVTEEVTPLATKLAADLRIEAVPDISLRCSAGLLHIVLANVVGNALKYLSGRPERRVTLCARVDGSDCRIDVADSGPGIPADALEKIFEPFYRVKGTRAEGTGIGLATVRRILDARGGRIAVESALGVGSTFSIWLPISASEARSGGVAPERNPTMDRDV
jgi:signal transduction histidine kinase